MLKQANPQAFGVWTRVGTRNHILGAVQISEGKGLSGRGAPARCGLSSIFFDHSLSLSTHCVAVEAALEYWSASEGTHAPGDYCRYKLANWSFIRHHVKLTSRLADNLAPVFTEAFVTGEL